MVDRWNIPYLGRARPARGTRGTRGTRGPVGAHSTLAVASWGQDQTAEGNVATSPSVEPSDQELI